MAVQLCVISNCTKTVYAKELCLRHYNKQIRDTKLKEGENCSIEGCNNKALIKGKCDSHYAIDLSTRRKAGLVPSISRSYNHGACKIEGCEKNAVSKKMCHLHYQQSRKHLPHVIEKRRERSRKYYARNKKVIKVYEPCKWEGCTQLGKLKSYCKSHYEMNWRRQKKAAKYL